MNNYYLSNAIKILLSLVLLNILTACGDDNKTGENVSKATTEMPLAIQKLSGTDGGTLRAFVTIDGDTVNRKEMKIDPAGDGSASVSISGLSRARHDVIISYEYTDDSGTLVLATSKKTVDLSSGSGSLSFAANEYELDSYDADGDNISNANELAAGSDPRVPQVSECILGTSTIGNCVLG